MYSDSEHSNEEQKIILTMNIYKIENEIIDLNKPIKNRKLSFIDSGTDNYGIGRKYKFYRYNIYDEYFDKYLIPTIKENSFIVSSKISPYNKLDKNTVIAIIKPKANKFRFKIFDYMYICDKNRNLITIRYIGDKQNLTEFSFAGFSNMFISYDSCYKNCVFDSINFSNINITNKCISVRRMFAYCDKLKHVDTHVLTHNKIQDFSEMFMNCSQLEKINLSSVSIKTDIEFVSKMFAYCTNLKEIDIKELIIKGNYNTDWLIDNFIFKGCYNLKTIFCKVDTWGKIKNSLILREFWIKRTEYKNKVYKLNNTDDKKVINKNKENLNCVNSCYVNTFYKKTKFIQDVTNNKLIQLI